MDTEKLGPAEKILQSILAYTDHLVHNRPGIVAKDGRTTIGVKWDYATWKLEDGQKVVYRLTKAGKRTVRTRAGVLVDATTAGSAGYKRVMDGGREVAEWRGAGLYPEVAEWMYRQVSDVWKMDNEFAARWASYQFGQESRDMKVILAAFMLVQSRKGEPVTTNGKLEFYDDDYRDIGEGMMLIYKKDGNDLSPKLLLRIRELLELPVVAAINRELGFGLSTREPVLGRWPKVVRKWLTYREENPQLLEGLVKAGFRSTVMTLASRSGYKPVTRKFFETLHWKQQQAEDGRRQIAIGETFAKEDTWEGLSEADICERVVSERPAYKKLVSLIPRGVGLTRAIMAAAIESACLSDKDLVIATPTIEELGLMNVQAIKDRWTKALRASEDMRAANIATRVKGKTTKEALEGAADAALKKAAEVVMKDIAVYIFVDRSGSMQQAIEAAVRLIGKLLPAFPLDVTGSDLAIKARVAYFNTVGTEVKFKAASAAGVAQAFRGVTGSGGTDYAEGVRTLEKYKPAETEDVLFIFIGDQDAPEFAHAVQRSGLRPMAFGFVYTPGNGGNHGKAVERTAAQLGIPCFHIDEKAFDDTYAIPRTIRALIGATPVGAPARAAAAPRRLTLVETILKTNLLEKPTWAAAA
jgi:hypothetical protein